jgi:hypothetical protein
MDESGPALRSLSAQQKAAVPQCAKSASSETAALLGGPSLGRDAVTGGSINRRLSIQAPCQFDRNPDVRYISET